MTAFHPSFELILKLFCMLVFLCPYSTLYAQGPCGPKACPRVKTTGLKKDGITVPPGPPPAKPVRPPLRNPPPICEVSELAVVCGMPGCEITLNGEDRSVTDDLGGITFEVEGKQRYRVRVTKPGYDTYDKTEEKLGCADVREVKASLTAKPVALRIRTKPAQCDIYLDGQRQPNGSDAQGQFSYVLAKRTLLIEAKKKGFLSATKNIFLVPELASREIVLELDPISAVLNLSSNVDNARVTVDNQKATKTTNERILLSPGPHTLTVEALGYTPVKLELTVGPDESVNKQIVLERLPLAALQSQASTLFLSRAYDDVLKLCRYIQEIDNNNALAHRLIGLVYLERGDLNNAGIELNKALAANETFALNIRRHASEKFELSRGHDSCEAQLILSKNEVEFKSLRNPADNFKVTYDQIQVIGIQVRSNVAVYLSTKVIVAGKRRDFNFYSYDKELSLSGKPYLEMVQRLLRPH